MKTLKKVILFFLIAAVSKNVICQNAFYDAQFLATVTSVQLNAILKASEIPPGGLKEDSPPVLSLTEYETENLSNYIKFLDQPFKKDIGVLDQKVLMVSIEKYNKHAEMLNGPTGMKGFNPGIATALALIPNFIGGKSSITTEQQSNIIDGLTKYYAEEFKKAQLLTYMQTFNNTIGKVGELQIIFPETYSKLQNADPSRFPDLGNEFKSVFNDDLKSVIDNLTNHIDNYKGDAVTDGKYLWLNTGNVTKIRENEYYDCFKIAGDIGSRLINNYHPADLFEYLDDKYYSEELLNSSKVGDKLKLVIHGLNLIQSNVRDTSKQKTSQFSNVWVNMTDFNQLNTDLEWIYFTGLLYQQDKNFFNKLILDSSKRSEKKISEKDILSKAEFALLKFNLNTTLSALVELQVFRSSLNDSNIKENYTDYMKLVLKLVESSNELITSNTKLTKAQLEKYLNIAENVINVYDNIRKKDYSNTMYYAVEIISELLPKSDSFLSVLNKIDKYGTFMSEVVNAKNSDEVKECIKKFAADPTSFILKREYRCTWSITGQPGYFAGMEKFDGSEPKFEFVSGLTLPMGFDLSFKTKHGTENRGSIGVFAQLIDLGAVLNFRISDSTSVLPDKIDIFQIFSPGGSVSYGFKNSPLNIAIGYQYTPQLRAVSLTNGNTIYPNALFILMVTGHLYDFAGISHFLILLRVRANK
jgi:hypothetical protein